MIPHNGTFINGKLFFSRNRGEYLSNFDFMEGFVGKRNKVDDIVSSFQLPILIEEYFLSCAIVEVDIFQKDVKL